jgi:hypothetical protein
MAMTSRALGRTGLRCCLALAAVFLIAAGPERAAAADHEDAPTAPAAAAASLAPTPVQPSDHTTKTPQPNPRSNRHPEKVVDVRSRSAPDQPRRSDQVLPEGGVTAGRDAPTVHDGLPKACGAGHDRGLSKSTGGGAKGASRLAEETACRDETAARVAEANAPQARHPRSRGESGDGADRGRLVATLEDLSFKNGEVPRARSALERIMKDFTKCAETEPGPAEGTVELRFIVRAPGRAEGVDVTKVRGVSSNVVQCATSALSLRSVGAPSTEPVAVILSVRFGHP